MIDPNGIAGKKVLVTGGTGFVGSHLVQRLLDLGAKTALLVRESSNEALVREFAQRGAVLNIGEITDEQAVKQAATGAEIIFHLAALFREAKFPDEKYFAVNTQGTKNVLDAAVDARVRRVVHCSTNGVHGTVGNTPADEQAPFAPCDVYQESKCEAERIVQQYVRAGKVEVLILRPCMIWGEGDKRILKLFRGIARRKLPLIGSGKTWTHWIYVKDLVEAFIEAALVANHNGEVYLIAGKTPVLMKDVYAKIAKLAGVPLLPFRVPALPIQIVGSIVELLCRPVGIEPPIYRRRVDFFVKNRHFNIAKAQREPGFTPRFEFDDELRAVFSWYKSQGWL